MQKNENQDQFLHLEQHKEIEERQVKIDIQELSKSLCKYCGDLEYKYNLCVKCSSEHKKESIRKITFVSGCLVGSASGIFLGSGSISVVFALCAGVVFQQTFLFFRG